MKFIVVGIKYPTMMTFTEWMSKRRMGREAMTKTLIGHDMAAELEGGDKDYAQALSKQVDVYLNYINRLYDSRPEVVDRNNPNGEQIGRIMQGFIDTLEYLRSYLSRHSTLGKNLYSTIHDGGESLPYARRGLIDLNVASQHMPRLRADTLDRIGLGQHKPQIMRVHNWLVTVFDRLRSLWQMNSTGDQFDKVNGPANSRDDKHWADFGHTASLSHLGTHKTI